MLRPLPRGHGNDCDMGSSIFVVDDDPALAKLVDLTLRLEGFEVQAFTSSLEALATLAKALPAQPSAIVLDLNMAEMDGREFYRAARESGYKNPVLILSAYGAEQAQQELGADAYLPKPFLPQELAKKVQGL